MNVSGQSVSFVDNSKGDIVAWQWNFGDGSASSKANPKHSFAPGDYTIVLKVTDSNGLSDTRTKSLHIDQASTPTPTPTDNPPTPTPTPTDTPTPTPTPTPECPPEGCTQP